MSVMRGRRAGKAKEGVMRGGRGGACVACLLFTGKAGRPWLLPDILLLVVGILLLDSLWRRRLGKHLLQ